MSRTAQTAKKPLPENLVAWLIEYRNDPERQLMVMPPPGMDITQAASEGKVLVRKDREDAPAWLGYPFCRAEKSAFQWVQAKGPGTAKPVVKEDGHTVIEPNTLQFQTSKGVLNLQLVAVDFPTKCGVYLNSDYYEIPDMDSYPEIVAANVVDTGDYE